jgi:hypothetical protein
VSESQQALTNAESDLATLHESLGRTVFGAVLSGEIPDQVCFSERQALERQIDDLQAEHDDLATVTDAGLRKKLTAKAKQVFVFGKRKLEERKIRAADAAVGHAIVMSDLDDSVRCATTASLLDRVAHCREHVSTCMTQRRQAEIARDNCKQDLCKTLLLAHFEGLQTLDSEIELCRRTGDEANLAMRQAELSVVESLCVAEQGTLPATLAGQLEQLKTILQREQETGSYLAPAPATGNGALHFKRKTGNSGALTKIKVLVDGKLKAKLAINQSEQVEVSPGQHEIEIKGGGSFRGDKTTVSVTAGSSFHFLAKYTALGGLKLQQLAAPDDAADDNGMSLGDFVDGASAIANLFGDD